jgi:hypothetical protein
MLANTGGLDCPYLLAGIKGASIRLPLVRTLLLLQYDARVSKHAMWKKWFHLRLPLIETTLASCIWCRTSNNPSDFSATVPAEGPRPFVVLSGFDARIRPRIIQVSGDRHQKHCSDGLFTWQACTDAGGARIRPCRSARSGAIGKMPR